MKLILIKIGKAFKTLQRDGFLRGGKRVMKAFLAMFGRVKAGDILFITGGVGDSALFRTRHYSEELELNGFKCSVTVQDNPFLSGYASKFKIFIFHRVLFTPSVKKLINNIKAQKKEIIFETDDLVFDPKYLEFMDFFKQMNVFERKLYENGVGGEILKDPYVKVCTTTTAYLAEKLREFNKKVFIIKNKLSVEDLRVVKEIEKNKSQIPNPKSQISLGYFSGTISHNKDFAVITDALLEIMEKHSNVELFLVGPLDIESKLNKFKDRIKQLPYVARNKHFENISQVDINLAPLEIGNPFCESKSQLKFFEAGIVGVPTVASATGTFKEAISDGLDGFVASDTSDWINKLERLILSPELCSRMGAEARKKALEQYSTQTAKNEEFYSFLRSKIANL
ncbi:MAG: glycosyltransferase [Parcubacteria group bacterium]|jgi:glycosyltransferase involved in cell wall biosynthesis